LASGRPNRHAGRESLGALRALRKAGCEPGEVRLIEAHFQQGATDGAEVTARLFEIAEFASAIGSSAARDYFRAVGETRAVAELTDRRVLDFARSVDPHTAEWYFWALWGTKAVPELTSDRVLRALKFFRAIDSQATVEYFLAIRETKAVADLTSERVLAFAESVGSDVAVEYFGACWETKAIPTLTSDRVLTFARSLDGDAAKEYFLALRETRSVAELTDERVLTFCRLFGGRVAGDYFRAIRRTKGALALTNDNVLVFAEIIGKGSARQYFRVVGATKAVAQLTDERVLRTSGVIRSIGTDAALDYFLAIATGKVVLPLSVGEGGPPTPEHAAPSEVLPLLEIPTYNRYRGAVLVGVSASFWWSLWQFGGGLVSPIPLEIALGAGIWAGVYVGAYHLLGVMTARSADQFLARRRRLLNEHGIRWHDCTVSDQRCELCWSPSHSHKDRKYDNGHVCRCPAC
jgi:hypothetical protein